MGRYGVNLGFIERPLFAGVAWGLLAGDMPTAVSLAVFYELFWLDLFPAGTYVPPNPLFPLLATLTLAGTTTNPGIATLFLPVIITLPLAFLGSRVERLQRELQVAGYNRITRSMRMGTDVGKAASRSVTGSLIQLFVLNFLVFFLATGCILYCYHWIAAVRGGLPAFPHASWPLLWIFGTLGGLLGLRIRRNFLVFAAGSVCVGIFALFGIGS